MSKVVKSVTRAVSNVVKGVVNVVKAVAAPVVNVVKNVAKAAVEVVKTVAKPVVEAVKAVASSKLGKVVLTAAAIYFGGAALAGAMGTIGTSTSFLSGMGAGVANAASSLSTAWSATMAGNFSQAGSALASGIQGQTAGNLMAGAAGNAGASAVAGATPTVQTAAQMGEGFAADMAASGAKPTSSGLVSGVWNSMGDRTKAAVISGGTQLIGGVVSGIGQQKAMEEQRNYEQQLADQARNRYTSSVDEFLAQAKKGAERYAPGQPPSGAAQSPNYDAVAEARAISERQRQEMEQYYQQQPTGLVARGMQFTQPTTNNNFPIYNPYYFRG